MKDILDNLTVVDQFDYEVEYDEVTLWDEVVNDICRDKNFYNKFYQQEAAINIAEKGCIGDIGTLCQIN